MYGKFMDDVLADILAGEERTKLNQINQLHPNLKFTVDEMKKDDAKEDEVGRIPFLDMELIKKNGRDRRK